MKNVVLRTACALLLACLAGATGCTWPWGQKSATIEPRMAYIDARSLLLQAAQEPRQVNRDGASEEELVGVQMNAIEGLGMTLGQAAGGTYLQAMSDPNPAVRFVAALVTGDTCYASAKQRLLAMARDPKVEPNRIVLCGVIYALHVLGDDEFTGQLGQLLFDPEPEVRGNAALAMERMDEPSAINPLKRLLAIETSERVKIQVQEAMAMLGDASAAMRLEGATKVASDAQLPAIDALGKIAAKGGPASWRAVRVLDNLLSASNPPRVRITAAGALARAGEVDDEGYALCVRTIRDTESVLGVSPSSARQVRQIEVEAAMLQRLAALSLGLMKRREAVDVLYPLLKHSDGGVRVAAATSILQILRSYSAEAVAGAGAPPSPSRGAAAPAPSAAPQPSSEPVPATPAAPTSQDGATPVPASAGAVPVPAPLAVPAASMPASAPASQPAARDEPMAQPGGLTPSLPRLHTAGGRD